MKLTEKQRLGCRIAGYVVMGLGITLAIVAMLSSYSFVKLNIPGYTILFTAAVLFAASLILLNLGEPEKPEGVIGIVFILLVGAFLGNFLPFSIGGEFIASQSINSIDSEYDNFKEILKDCDKEKEGIDKVECVGAVVRSKYHFTEAHPFTQEVDYTLEHGGVCKDYAKIYSTMAEEYKMENQLIYVDKTHNEKHVFNIISEDEFFCLLNMFSVTCFEYGD